MDLAEETGREERPTGAMSGRGLHGMQVRRPGHHLKGCWAATNEQARDSTLWGLMRRTYYAMERYLAQEARRSRPRSSCSFGNMSLYRMIVLLCIKRTLSYRRNFRRKDLLLGIDWRLSKAQVT